MAALIPVARQQYTDGNGSPLVGGSVLFAQPSTGGATTRPIWADEAETTPLSNPIGLDSAGITFSGGSQVSVWGFGQYEEFVYDSNGVLIYSALLDTSGGLTGGTIDGSVQINGDLSVTGNITDTQSLTTPTINGTNGSFGGTLNVASLVAANSNIANSTIGTSTVTGNEQVGGNSNVGGSISAGGVTTGGGVSAGSLSVGSGGANFNNNAVNNVSTLGVGTVNSSTVNTNALFIDGQPVPRISSGSFTTNAETEYTVTFPAFNNVDGIVLTPVNNGQTSGESVFIMIVQSYTTSQLVIGVPNADGENTFIVMWMVVGT